MNFLMRFPEGKCKTLTLSYDDGVESDIRLIDILDKHGIKATFNINTGCFGNPGGVTRRLTKDEAKKLYSNPNHEIAVHSLTHPHLEEMSIEACTYEVIQDRINLEKMFEKPIRGMAYPFGTYNETVIQSLKACGIAYSRTVKNDDSFKLPENWLELKATCHHKNPRLTELCDNFLNLPDSGSAKMFYLWGHSYEFLSDNNWNVIEEFAKKMGGHNNIWYATNIEIYEYIEAFNQLKTSADNSIIHNPTTTELFFAANGKELSVKPGETVKVNR